MVLAFIYPSYRYAYYCVLRLSRTEIDEYSLGNYENFINKTILFPALFTYNK